MVQGQEAVGYSLLTGGSVSHAFLYSNGYLQDLGAFGANSATNTSLVSCMNDRGNVVGYSYLPDNSGTVHAFLYTEVRQTHCRAAWSGTESSSVRCLQNTQNFAI